MKQTSTRILACSAFAVAAFFAWKMTTTSQPASTSPLPPAREATSSMPSTDVTASLIPPTIVNTRVEAWRDDREHQSTERRMNSRTDEITRRIGVATAFADSEDDDPAAAESIRELQESGFIIPATLEEVEAALAAAALTPETEDDQAALILKHRGSYRFLSEN